jgi:hypothetical protein
VKITRRQIRNIILEQFAHAADAAKMYLSVFDREGYIKFYENDEKAWEFAQEIYSKVLNSVPRLQGDPEYVVRTIKKILKDSGIEVPFSEELLNHLTQFSHIVNGRSRELFVRRNIDTREIETMISKPRDVKYLKEKGWRPAPELTKAMRDTMGSKAEAWAYQMEDMPNVPVQRWVVLHKDYFKKTRIKHPWEIAVVIGHEIAHHFLNHLGKVQEAYNKSINDLMSGNLELTDASGNSVSIDAMEIMGEISSDSLSGDLLSQTNEIHADILGCYFARLAGYNIPEGGCNVGDQLHRDAMLGIGAESAGSGSSHLPYEYRREDLVTQNESRVKITRKQIKQLIREELLRESEEFTLGYESNEPSADEHASNVRDIERWFEEVREEFIGCTKEEIGRTREEGLYGELYADGVTFNDWVLGGEDSLVAQMNRRCPSPMFGNLVVNEDGNELLGFLMKVFLARTNLVLITGPNDPNWGAERGRRLENEAFFRSYFGARMSGGGDTRRQIERHLEGDHNTIYFYMYGVESDGRAKSIGESSIKDTLAHEFGHARQKLTQGFGQALLTMFGLYDELEVIDAGIVDELIEPWLKASIGKEFDSDTEDMLMDKWENLGGDLEDDSPGGSVDQYVNAAEWLQLRTYSANEVHNILTTDLRRELLKTYGPLYGNEPEEVAEFYEDAMRDFLGLSLAEIHNQGGFDWTNSEMMGFRLLLRDDQNIDAIYGELASAESDHDHDHA